MRIKGLEWYLSAMSAEAYENEKDMPREIRVKSCTYSVGGETCGRKLYCRGLCRAHYLRRWRKLPMGPVKVRGSHGKKLSDAQVLVIHRKVSTGVMGRQEAADRFKVSYSTICDIMKGRRVVQQQDTAADS